MKKLFTNKRLWVISAIGSILGFTIWSVYAQNTSTDTLVKGSIDQKEVFTSKKEAFLPYIQMLKEAGVLGNSEYLNYEYDLSLQNIENGSVTDEINGSLKKGPNEFLDSNKYTLTFLNKDTFFKCDHQSHEAYVFNLKKMSGHNLEEMQSNNMLINIPDSLLTKMGNFNIEYKRGDVTKISYALLDSVPGLIRKFAFTFNEQSRKLEEVYVYSEPESDGEFHYQRVCRMFHFEYNTPASIDEIRRRYLSFNNNKVQLKGAISSYELSTNL